MQPHCAVGMHRLPQKLNAKVEVKMKKLLIYMKKFRKECILAPLFKLLEATFELFVPLIVAAIIDNGIDGKSKSFIIYMGLLLLALAAVGLLCSVTAQFLAAKAAIGFSSRRSCHEVTDEVKSCGMMSTTVVCGHTALQGVSVLA